jgi:hypothetical protein
MYGVFKCTSAGLYFFSFTAMSPEGKDLRVSLRTNRIPVVTIYTGAANAFNSASGSTVLSLTEDDIVYLYVEKGDIYESNQVNRAFTTFSGFQLSEKKSAGFLSSLIGRNGGTASINSIFGDNVGQPVLETDVNDYIFGALRNATQIRPHQLPSRN